MIGGSLLHAVWGCEFCITGSFSVIQKRWQLELAAFVQAGDLKVWEGAGPREQWGRKQDGRPFFQTGVENGFASKDTENPSYGFLDSVCLLQILVPFPDAYFSAEYS